MTTSEGLAGALRTALDHDRARPVLTYLDPSTDERTELSAATLDNWVAKTANLLLDEVAVEPGALVAVRLPLHWQAWVWLLATWTAGCRCSPGTAADLDAAGADLLVTTADAGARAPVGPELLTLALRPLALPGGPAPAGALDYDVAVRAHGDTWAGPAPDPSGPALLLGASTWTGAELTERAGAAALAWGVGPGDRVAVDAAPASLPALLAVLAPLLAGAAVLLVAPHGAGPALPSGLGPLLGQEGVTALAPDWAGAERPGARRLARL